MTTKLHFRKVPVPSDDKPPVETSEYTSIGSIQSIKTLMWHLSWEAFRAYLSPFLLAIIALLGIAKDAKDYKELAADGGGKGLANFAKKNIVGILYFFTGLVAILGFFDIHAARVETFEAAAKANVEKKSSQTQIEGLNTQIQGLRQDGLTNAKTFTDSFSRLNDKFSDLQTKVKNEDLMKQLASTKEELALTLKGLSPKPKAVVESSFEYGKQATTPIRFTQARLENGVVTLQFTLYNLSDVDGLNGAFKVQICDSCKYAEEPNQFMHLADDPDQIREYDFQHVFKKSKLPPFTFKITVPNDAPLIEIGTMVLCETCDRVRNEVFRVAISH